MVFFVLAIIKEENIIPLDIVHLKEKDCFIIPFEIDEWHFQSICEKNNDVFIETVDDFFFSLIDLDINFTYNTAKVFTYLEEKINTFTLMGYSELLEIPENLGPPLLFIDNIKVSLKPREELKVNELLNINLYF